MANDPDPGSEPEEPNPFKGTPFEQLFAAGGPLAGMGGLGALGGLGGAGGAGGPGGLGGLGGMDFNQIMNQVKAMMEPHDGPLNWKAATDLARSTVAQQADPSPSQRDRDRVADAVQLADHWLDTATGFSSGVTSTAAWSRAEWIVETLPVWKVLVEPVAAKSVSGLGSALPEGMQATAGPLLGIIGQAVGGMLASQVGQGLGGLAGEVLTASDIGVPLGAPGKAALVMSNVKEFAEGLDVTEDDVLLYLALREAAHQRLFAHVPWLREHLVGAVTDYAQGLELNVQQMQERIEEQMRNINPMDPSSMQGLMEGGLFEPPVSPRQEAALARLEIALALVEGWVDEVVGQATAERMPAAAKLREAVRRRRAAGGPAEQTFAALVGLELRPRRLRDASTLWGGLRARSGAEARDGVWMHPDLLPTAADLDDPLTFRAEATQPEELTEDAFDEELRKLLDGEGGEGGEGGESEE
ncbi:hydrolase [Nocardioides silvaticus]|uniref:Hydrolase n=1 Tax=Nocardioides silvaticus TaxID=2201891 RepID=A0A316TQ90_9ACTN|nr:zinc-dependent metalloprotease [Nocardioides silvaticus]PWN04402.1 hydrolase [Nocardioides silvaticus]